MKIEWLQKKVTIEEAEQHNVVSDETLGPEPVPFGCMNDEWLDFREKIQEGDELWEFNGPQEHWNGFCGREGVCIVREGDVVDSLVTMLS